MENLSKKHEDNIGLVEVLDSILSTRWHPLVGSKLRIKKRLKTKTHVYIYLE